MIRNLLPLFYILFSYVILPVPASAQSINVSVTPATSGNGPSVFSLANGTSVELESRKIRFPGSGFSSDFAAVGISPDRTVVSLLDNVKGRAGVTLLSAGGDTLNKYTSIALGSNDPSLSAYPTNAGHLLLRNNIMNFTFHDELGEVGTNISNGSSTRQGETISELVTNPDHETFIIYTSKIKSGNSVGSKVQLIDADKQLRRIFRSDDRYIKDLKLSDEGSMLTIVTAADGTNDRVIVMDKYGNEINTIVSEEELAGASLADDGKHLTLFSENRIRVYDLLNAKNIGSTSLRQPVFMADYFSEDDMLLIISGYYSSSSANLNNIEVKAVDLVRRDIVSENFSEELHFHEAFTTDIKRTSSNKYQLEGANKELSIEVAF
ncbi:hypothetical protein SAMN05443144_10856 [Fodinibius roseus]|uniref:Uncharacterized protein n=1 Tax=Fodinibius roseus TaxID=1194090 RepID=A0A1M5BAI4_9BACT|nr:hypothetical protein [Fodinibius roseus]SHF39416.1 hypothetical protein SAMN05443144_10856 [Fodinibius roseus]